MLQWHSIPMIGTRCFQNFKVNCGPPSEVAQSGNSCSFQILMWYIFATSAESAISLYGITCLISVNWSMITSMTLFPLHSGRPIKFSFPHSSMTCAGLDGTSVDHERCVWWVCFADGVTVTEIIFYWLLHSGSVVLSIQLLNSQYSSEVSGWRQVRFCL